MWNEPRPFFREQVFAGNAFLATRPVGTASPEGVPFLYTRLLGEMDSIRGHSYHFPIRLKLIAKGGNGGSGLFDARQVPREPFQARPRIPGQAEHQDPDADAKTAGLVWMHALAIGYSPAYLSENADGIRPTGRASRCRRIGGPWKHRRRWDKSRRC